MCHYCGCREIPLIKEFVAEHERVTDAAGDALRAPVGGDLPRAREPADGDLPRAREPVGVMARELESHWRGKENGLFAVMREDPTTARLRHRAVLTPAPSP
ncbi:hypothetical protein [Streptomyces sp. NPDC048419]|uniref:hypothetical protein n=1 Tax=Streptomyces sp. NPDC048419 TaxID=3365547 RepID=UPI00371EF5B3